MEIKRPPGLLERLARAFTAPFRQQREWRSQGRCVYCGGQRYRGDFCEEHYIDSLAGP